jgi:hypothetical protein
VSCCCWCLSTQEPTDVNGTCSTDAGNPRYGSVIFQLKYPRTELEGIHRAGPRFSGCRSVLLADRGIRHCSPRSLSQKNMVATTMTGAVVGAEEAAVATMIESPLSDDNSLARYFSDGDREGPESGSSADDVKNLRTCGTRVVGAVRRCGAAGSPADAGRGPSSQKGNVGRVRCVRRPHRVPVPEPVGGTAVPTEAGL